jgi:hypothetical protein
MKQQYEAPTVTEIGTVEELTFGVRPNNGPDQGESEGRGRDGSR